MSNIRNINKKLPRSIYGVEYTWTQLLAVVRASLKAEGHDYARNALAMALAIRKLPNYKPKHKDTDSVLLEYARYVLKNRSAEPEQVLLTIEDNPVSV